MENNDQTFAIFDAIIWRINRQHKPLIEKFGTTKIFDVAFSLATILAERNLEEIGSSDISSWVKDVANSLEVLDQYNLLEAV
jgi:hypothetical protein